jgi:hypothetical protein
MCCAIRKPNRQRKAFPQGRPAIFDALIGAIVMLGVPAYIALQIYIPKHLRGGWWWAAMAPVFIAIPVALFCLLAFAQESNLWPLAFILFAPLGAAYLGILNLFRRLAR